MRPILLVVCALHASHALQAPRPQCTTSLQTPRPHRVTSLRASPPAETEEAPTAQWLASLALAGAALGPVCDNFHSAAGVLGYTKYQIALGPAPDWWGGGILFCELNSPFGASQGRSKGAFKCFAACSHVASLSLREQVVIAEAARCSHCACD